MQEPSLFSIYLSIYIYIYISIYPYLNVSIYLSTFLSVSLYLLRPAVPRYTSQALLFECPVNHQQCLPRLNLQKGTALGLGTSLTSGIDTSRTPK